MFMEKYKKIIEEMRFRTLENQKRVIELVKRYKSGDETISIIITKHSKNQP